MTNVSDEVQATARKVARVERTFGFLDLSGSTNYVEVEGDDRAVEMMMRFRAVVRGVAASRGVRIAKWLGDGAMLVAVEGDRLVDAVIEIESELESIDFDLPIRAGVAVGSVILLEGDDYIGGVVNLAARLCDLAGPQEVMAPAVIVDRLPLRHSTAVVVGPREVRGFEEPIEMVLLTAAVDR